MSFRGASRVIRKGHMSTIANLLLNESEVGLQEKEMSLKSCQTFLGPSRSHIEDILLYDHSLIKEAIDTELLKIKPKSLSIDHTFQAM